MTNKTRTDTNFKQNLDVTAVFAAGLRADQQQRQGRVGRLYTFNAKLGGKHLTADSIRWYANGGSAAAARPP